MSIITIHEFSTGIQVDGNPHNWFSRGFSGSYMNSTLPQIPVGVQNSISLREFAVAEGTSRDEPAIIGREISGNGEDWSVIAVVTRGKDDRGRSVSLYRYFLTERIGNLGHILAWMLKLGSTPVFNPFEVKNVGQSISYNTDQTNTSIPILPALQEILKQNLPPIVISFNQPCTSLILNLMANTLGSPTAWAYNVEAVVKPTRFQLIYPASNNAEQVIKNALLSTPKDTGGFAEEQPIKTAIKNLMRRETVNIEQLEIFGQVLGNSQVTSEQLTIIFENQGSKDAIKHGNYNASNVRLLTLQAIAIPETLPEFLKWLQKREKPTDHLDICLSFQNSILQTLESLPDRNFAVSIMTKVSQGVKLIIPILLKQTQLFDAIVWLFSSKNGLWYNHYFEKIRIELNNDFKVMGSFAKGKNVTLTLANNEDWKKLLNNLKTYWQPHAYKISQSQYLPLGEFFEAIETSSEERNIALFFYHVAYGFGNIPPEKFELIDRRNKFSAQVYGLKIKRKMSPIETILQSFVELLEFIYYLIIKGVETIVPLPIVIILLVLFSGFSFWGGKIIGEKPSDDKNTTGQTDGKSFDDNVNDNKPNPLNTREATTTTKPSRPSPSTYKIETDQSLSGSGKAIEKLIQDFDQYLKYKNTQKMEETIVQILKDVSGNINLTFEDLVTGKKEGIDAIKLYQKEVMNAKDEAADGKIEANKNTYQVLKCHVADDLEINLSSRDPSLCGAESSYQKWKDKQPKPPVG